MKLVLYLLKKNPFNVKVSNYFDSIKSFQYQ